MRVRWLPEAWQDTQRLHGFLVAQNPSAAARAIDALSRSTDRLADVAESGQPMSDNTGGIARAQFSRSRGLKKTRVINPQHRGCATIRLIKST